MGQQTSHFLFIRFIHEEQTFFNLGVTEWST